MRAVSISLSLLVQSGLISGFVLGHGSSHAAQNAYSHATYQRTTHHSPTVYSTGHHGGAHYGDHDGGWYGGGLHGAVASHGLGHSVTTSGHSVGVGHAVGHAVGVGHGVGRIHHGGFGQSLSHGGGHGVGVAGGVAASASAYGAMSMNKEAPHHVLRTYVSGSVHPRARQVVHIRRPAVRLALRNVQVTHVLPHENVHEFATIHRPIFKEIHAVVAPVTRQVHVVHQPEVREVHHVNTVVDTASPAGILVDGHNVHTTAHHPVHSPAVVETRHVMTDVDNDGDVDEATTTTAVHQPLAPHYPAYPHPPVRPLHPFRPHPYAAPFHPYYGYQGFAPHYMGSLFSRPYSRYRSFNDYFRHMSLRGRVQYLHLFRDVGTHPLGFLNDGYHSEHGYHVNVLHSDDLHGYMTDEPDYHGNHFVAWERRNWNHAVAAKVCETTSCINGLTCLPYFRYDTYVPVCAHASPGIPRSTMCHEHVDHGTCTSQFRRYYFNTKQQRCLPFHYSGCGGNMNRFESYFECHQKCMEL